ncbi:MAG: homocysteine S-methyltransferase [Caulobacteraceae bacterium]|nr:homocysteine S-methyltransferase [Caulobacteraceae bacterium]
MPEDPIAFALRQRDVLVLDGAMGTELERRGETISDALWSARLLVDAPERIGEIHRDYLAAGADVIVTASYQASLEGFVARGLSADAARQAMRRSAELALAERDAFWDGLDPAARDLRLRALVAGGIGPFGAALADGSEFRGDYPMDPARLGDFHRPRIEALLAGGVDLLALETFPSAAEAKVVVDLLKRDFPHASAWVSFSARDCDRISDGTKIEAAAEAVADRACVAAVGVNCTAPEHIGELVRRIATVTDKPVVVYPNSGGKWDHAIHGWRDGAEHPPLAKLAPAWRAAGARLIGGCCRTSPADIAALREVVG